MANVLWGFSQQTDIIYLINTHRFPSVRTSPTDKRHYAFMPGTDLTNACWGGKSKQAQNVLNMA